MIDSMPFVVYDTNLIDEVMEKGNITIGKYETKLENTDTITKPKLRAKHKNFHLTFDLGIKGSFEKLTVRGSIHYYANNGKSNEDQLTLSRFKESCSTLMQELHLKPDKCFLLPPEFGVNIELNPDYFLGNRLSTLDIVTNTMCENRKMFSENPVNCNSSKISGNTGYESQFKVYGKSDQLHSMLKHLEILRMEVHQNKNRYLKKNGIITLQDLQKKESHLFLRRIFFDRMGQLVIYDPTIEIPISNKYWKNTLAYSNRNFWLSLILECRGKPSSKSKYNYHLKKLRELSAKFGCNLHSNLTKMVIAQYDQNLRDSTFL